MKQPSNNTATGTERVLTLRSDSLKYLRENYKTKQNNLSPYIPDLGTDIESASN